MAIPFNLPTDEETEENYRRLDQLLLDLYEVLRQILLRRRLQRAPVVPRQNPEPAQQAGAAAEQAEVGRDLPDLVQGGPLARKPPVPPPRRRRRRTSENKVHQSGVQQQQRSAVVQRGDAAAQGPSWLNVGIELRQIAEEFRSTQFCGVEEKRRKEIKASSLFSLLVPAPLTGSIWTTVIILVGWRILARHR